MAYTPPNPNGQATSANSSPVVIASDQSAVPVSNASLPLPSGAATSAKQDTGNTSLSSIDGKITAVNTGAVVVSSSALPSGASTSAKQPAIGTAGTASADVITVQGIASMTALKVDGSAVTQPISVASIPSHAVTNAGTFAVQAAGDVAAGATDSGSPVKTGGKFNSTRPTLTDGQRGDTQLDSNGNIGVRLYNGTAAASFGADNADAVAVSSTADKLRVITRPSVYNGTSWDRVISDGTTGGQGVGGTVASATTDSGNPIKIGAVFNSSLPTFTDGQRFNLQGSNRGSLFVNIKDGANSITGATSASDAQTNNKSGLWVYNIPVVSNGTTLDTLRNNTTAQLIAAGTSTTQTNQAITTYNARSLVVVVNIASGAGSVVVAINGTTTNAYQYNLLTSASLSGVGVTALQVGPGITAATNLAAASVLPRNVQVTVTVTGTIAYGVDYILGV